MKPSVILRLEETFLLLLSFFLFAKTGISRYWYPVFFLAPDLSMFGYLAGNNYGAIFYNLGHHRAIAIGLYLAGSYLQQPIIQVSGLIMLGHISFDRILGYGLKFPDSFQHTHLGWIGRQSGKDLSV